MSNSCSRESASFKVWRTSRTQWQNANDAIAKSALSARRTFAWVSDTLRRFSNNRFRLVRFSSFDPPSALSQKKDVGVGYSARREATDYR